MAGTVRWSVVVVVAAAATLAACVGDDEEEVAVIETPTERVAEVAAERLDIAADAVEVVPSTELDDSGCLLFTARDPQALDGVSDHYAVLADGTVLVGPSTAAVVQVLDQCYAATGAVPSGSTMAELVVRLADTPGPMQVLSSGWARDRLAELGLADEPPMLAETDDGYSVTFLAEDLEFDVVTRVVATRSDEGTVRIAYEEL